MTIYIIGRMRGLERFGWFHFARAANELRWRNWTCIVPFEEDLKAGFDVMRYQPEEHGLTWDNYPPGFDVDACLDRNKKNVTQANAIFILANGLGANGLVELDLALKLDKLVCFEHNGFPLPQVLT